MTQLPRRSVKIVGFLTATCLVAQPVLADTLREALALAYEYNPTIAAARAQVRAADEGVPLAKAQGRPSAQAQGTYNEFLIQGGQSNVIGAPRTTSGPDRSVGLNVTMSVPLYQGGLVGNSVAAADARGQVVSAIQSTYFEFGSGLVLPQTGVIWQNRGASFRLAPEGWNCLKPGRKPFHTLNPALAHLDDGRVMVYGTMGGEGQPQTQAAIFARHVWGAMPLQQAVTAPRWLLGRTWGEESTSLKCEAGMGDDVYAQLRRLGHDVEMVPALNSMMGHAGAIVRHANGLLEGASDPRSDGLAAAV